MFKMQIQMDEEKILREDVINLQKVYIALDEIFAENGLFKEGIAEDGTITYCGSESNKDFGRFTCVYMSLTGSNKDWFVPNCKKWLIGDNEEIPGVWDWDDILEGMRKRGEL